MGGNSNRIMYQFLSSANKCMVQSKQPTPSLLSQLPNTAVCLVCTIVPLLWLSGRFASLANGSGAELPLICIRANAGNQRRARMQEKERDGGREGETESGKTVVRRGRQTAAARGTMFRFSIQPFVKVERISEWAEI